MWLYTWALKIQVTTAATGFIYAKDEVAKFMS